MNSPLSESYHWLVEFEYFTAAAIMLFFFSIGIELRQEFSDGSLSHPRKAAVPILATFGGMALPAILFSVVNAGTDAAEGWAIPMSTDVAFALAVLAIAGKSLPKQVRMFLLTVAVVDDATSILILAIFFTSSLNILSLVSITGVTLGLLLPAGNRVLPKIQPTVTFVALPVFALLSSGVILHDANLEEFAGSTITIGVLVAMLIGKPIGVFGTAWLVAKMKIGKLAAGLKWADLASIAPLFGMCFTVAMLFTDLSYGTSDDRHLFATISVLVGNLSAGLIGFITLRLRSRAYEQ
jgi:NhaA family Na+:H+ antiporter